MKVSSGLLKSLFVVCLVAGCKQKYDPPVIKTDLSLLVVDGFLNNSSDTTFIRLSRTKKLQDGTFGAEESNVSMSVEDESGIPVYAFQELKKGTYFVPGMTLDSNKKYHLRINTPTGKQYISDDVSVQQTPPLDSVSWERKGDGVRIYANTHDPLNKTLYYRWDYTETFHYASYFYSIAKYVGDTVIDRPLSEQVADCWSTRNSTDILIGTSAKLSSDIIYLAPIRYIPLNAIEISIKYSILLRQYALTKASYEYYENLKKITEQLGSIFDAQPSQLTGNLHCVDTPGEVVLGFLTASSMSSTRIFIDRSEVDPWKYTLFCSEAIVIPKDSATFYFQPGSSHTPIDIIRSAFSGKVTGYHGGETGCVDCTTRGGVANKPDFWP